MTCTAQGYAEQTAIIEAGGGLRYRRVTSQLTGHSCRRATWAEARAPGNVQDRQCNKVTKRGHPGRSTGQCARQTVQQSNKEASLRHTPGTWEKRRGYNRNVQREPQTRREWDNTRGRVSQKGPYLIVRGSRTIVQDCRARTMSY